MPRDGFAIARLFEPLVGAIDRSTTVAPVRHFVIPSARLAPAAYPPGLYIAVCGYDGRRLSGTKHYEDVTCDECLATLASAALRARREALNLPDPTIRTSEHATPH